MDENVEIKPLISILEKLFDKTFKVCIKGGVLKENEIEYVKEQLLKERLTPEFINDDICEELKNVCTYEYNEVTLGSNRLNGKGYSSYKINENMKIFLKERLTKFATILSLKKILKPLSLQKSFHNTLAEIYNE